MIILRQKVFGGNRENKQKKKEWERRDGLKRFEERIADNGTNPAQWKNPVDPKLLERKEFLKEGSEKANAELRAIHRNKMDYGDIRRNISKKVLEKHTDYGGMFNGRVDSVAAAVEDGNNAYNRVMDYRSKKRKEQHESSRNVNKRGVKKSPTSIKPKMVPEVISTNKSKSVLGGLSKRIGQGLRKLAFR